MTDSSDWKRKYLDQLDEVETLERRHRDERHRLERLLVLARSRGVGHILTVGKTTTPNKKTVPPLLQ